MKNVLLLFLALVSVTLNAQTNLLNKGRIPAVISNMHNPAIQAKMQSTQYRLTGLLEQQYSGGAFGDVDSANFTYDAGYGSGALDLLFGQYTGCYVVSFDGTVWVNYYHLVNTYVGDHQRTNLYYETWDGAAFDPYEQILYTYNGDGTLADYTAQIYSGGSWVNISKEIYVYTLSGALDYETSQSWSGTDWMNNYRQIYTYDGSGRKIVDLTQSYVASTWVDDTRNEYVYNVTGTLATDTYQSSDGVGGFDDVSRYVYTYDGTNSLINQQQQTYSGTWDNYDKTEFTVNAWGLPDVSLQSDWDGAVYNPNFKVFYHYESYESTGIKPELPIEPVAIFPNPATDDIHLQFTDETAETIRMNITDLQGRTVILSQANAVPGENTVIVHIGDKQLAPGTYLIHAATETKNYVGKFIVQ